MIRLFLMICMVFSSLITTGEAFCETQKDTLTVCMGTALIKSLDPAVSNTRQVLTLYHNWGDTLLYRNPKDGKIVPCLAESYRFLNNGSILLSLRKGVTFHNGEPFNAKAVKFSLNLLKKSDSRVSGYFAGIKDIVVLDDHTVRIDVIKPIPTLFQLLANVMFIYPPTTISKWVK